jgi:hypothetical protein
MVWDRAQDITQTSAAHEAGRRRTLFPPSPHALRTSSTASDPPYPISNITATSHAKEHLPRPPHSPAFERSLHLSKELHGPPSRLSRVQTCGISIRDSSAGEEGGGDGGDEVAQTGIGLEVGSSECQVCGSAWSCTTDERVDEEETHGECQGQLPRRVCRERLELMFYLRIAQGRAERPRSGSFDVAWVSLYSFEPAQGS